MRTTDHVAEPLGCAGEPTEASSKCGIARSMLAEFEKELNTTRKFLERVPADRLTWRPHEKSMTMGRLAGHLAEIPGWASITIEQDSFDVAPPGAPPYQTPQANSRREILEMFDHNVAAARAAIAGADDGRLKKVWSLLNGGKTVLTLPRIGVLRSFILSHSIHHRAQLGVYLRLNNVPVPAIYGPSADEGGM